MDRQTDRAQGHVLSCASQLKMPFICSYLWFFSGFYYEGAKENKFQIICVKSHIEEKDSRLDASFKTYERAQLRANYVKEEYENYLSTSMIFNTSFSRKGKNLDGFSNDIVTEVMTSMAIEQGRAFELITTEDIWVHAGEGMWLWKM